MSATPALIQVAGLALVSAGIAVLLGTGAGMVAAGLSLFVIGFVLDIPRRR